MNFIYIFISLVLFSLNSFAENHDGNDPMVEIGTGAYFEDEAVAFLVKAKFEGIQSENDSKYFIVHSHIVYGNAEGNKGVLEFDMNVVPYEKEFGDDSNFRALPFQVSRELALDINQHASFEIVGFSIEKENEENVQNKIYSIAEVTVDAIGMNYIKLRTNEVIKGLQVARTELEAGFAMNLNNDRTISFVAELENSFSKSGNYGYLFTELSAKMSYSFKMLNAKYSAFIQGVYERFDQYAINHQYNSSVFFKKEFNFRIGLTRKF